MANKSGKYKGIQKRDKILPIRLSQVEIEYIDMACKYYKDAGVKNTSRADIIVQVITADLTRRGVFV